MFSPKNNNNDKKFWYQLSENLKNFHDKNKENSDLFKNNLKIQIDKSNRHLINYDII